MTLMNYADTAELLGLKTSTLYAMVSRQQIPYVRLGKRLVRFDRDQLLEWLTERTVVPAGTHTRLGVVGGAQK